MIVLLLLLVSCNPPPPPADTTPPEDTAPEPPPDIPDVPDTPDLGEPPPIPPVESSPDELVASSSEWRYLTDLDHTEQVLSSSPIRWGSSRVQIKMLERMGEEARAIVLKLSLDTDSGRIRAQAKVRQSEYYFEWKREILGYRLGRLLHVPVVPAVDRTLPNARLKTFSYKMTEEDYAVIHFGPQGVRASVRYWVESLNPRRIGARLADESYLSEIASSLHPANRDQLPPVYLDMGRAFVFDYLVLNDDRARNLGTVLSPTSDRRLVLIDNGLAFGFQTSSRTKAQSYFEAMSLFPRDTIDALRSLTEPQITDLLVPPDDDALSIKSKAATQLWTRRDAVLARVDELHALYGDLVYY